MVIAIATTISLFHMHLQFYLCAVHKFHWCMHIFIWRARPTTAKAQAALIDDLQDMKTVFYKQIIEEVASARPGVLELMDAAIADPNLKVRIHFIKHSHYPECWSSSTPLLLLPPQTIYLLFLFFFYQFLLSKTTTISSTIIATSTTYNCYTLTLQLPYY